MEKVIIQLEALTCPSCIQKIEKAISGQAGVEEVNVLFNASKVKINSEETQAEKLTAVVEKLGFTVENMKVKKV